MRNCLHLLRQARPVIRTLMYSQYRQASTSDKSFIFRQLFDQRTFTYTYLLGDLNTRDSILIDPVVELVDRDLKVINELGLRLKYAVNTHCHADHVTGTGEIKRRLPEVRSAIAEASGAKADWQLKPGEHIEAGEISLECRSTPGHTDGCMTFVWPSMSIAFTGDALLIRGCGRTDFQQGSAAVLYDSVHNKILSLPDATFLYPAHDYTGQTVTTVAEEKKHNPRLTKDRDSFIKIMEELNLPYPRFIDEALPANLVCGIQELIPQKTN